MINFPNLYIATWIMTVTHGKKIISAINNTLLSCAHGISQATDCISND